MLPGPVGLALQKGWGEMSTFAAGFYRSKQWQHTKDAYAKSVDGLCENCLRKGIYRPGVIVHHKIPLTPERMQHPEVTLSWGNLELLCRDCHGEVHRKGKRYKFDAFGNVIVAPVDEKMQQVGIPAQGDSHNI